MSYEKFQSCINACYECATECKRCSSACLGEQDVKNLTQCIRLNSDCATICVLAAKMMAGGSEFSERICELCADICDSCAMECEKHSEPEQCKKCAEVCRKCAFECREMNKISIE